MFQKFLHQYQYLIISISFHMLLKNYSNSFDLPSPCSFSVSVYSYILTFKSMWSPSERDCILLFLLFIYILAVIIELWNIFFMFIMEQIQCSTAPYFNELKRNIFNVRLRISLDLYCIKCLEIKYMIFCDFGKTYCVSYGSLYILFTICFFLL